MQRGLSARYATYLANVAVTYGPQNLNAILKKILFSHLKQVDHLGTITPWIALVLWTRYNFQMRPTDEESNVGEQGTNSRGCCNKEVDAFPVCQPRHDYDSYCPYGQYKVERRSVDCSLLISPEGGTAAGLN